MSTRKWASGVLIAIGLWFLLDWFGFNGPAAAFGFLVGWTVPRGEARASD